jgi:hypothetical protein
MGDCATIKDFDLPATAQVANQKAIYLGEGKCYSWDLALILGKFWLHTHPLLTKWLSQCSIRRSRRGLKLKSQSSASRTVAPWLTSGPGKLWSTCHLFIKRPQREVILRGSSGGEVLLLLFAVCNGFFNVLHMVQWDFTNACIIDRPAIIDPLI